MPAGPFTQVLLTDTAGGLITGTPQLGAVYNASNFTLNNFTTSGTSIAVTVTGTTAPTTEYWQGGFTSGSNVWSISNGSTASNWTTNQAGTAATSLTPGAATTINFSASTPANNALGTILGSNMSILGMVVSDPNGVSLNFDGNTLTTGSGGITLNAGAGAVTLATPITLGAAQAWTNNSSNLLTVSTGGMGLNNGGNTLTIAGSGATSISTGISGAGGLTQNSANSRLLLSGPNTYSGATTLSGGTLFLVANAANTSSGVTSALSNSTTALTLGGNTTLELLGNTNNTIFEPASAAANSTTGGVIETDQGSGPFNFYVGNSGSGTGNTLILANFGQFGSASTSPAYNLYGANGYTLQIGSGAAGTGALDVFNNTAINSNTPGITLSIPGGITINFGASYTLTFGGAGNITLGTLTPDAGNTIPVIYNGAGTLSLIGTNTAPGLVTVNNGTVIFTGSNSSTSGLTINGGAVQLKYANVSGTNVIAAGNALTLGGGGTLSILGNASGNTSQTLASLTVNAGPSSIALTPAGSGATTLTITGTTLSTNSTGSLNFNYVGGGAGTTSGATVGNDYVAWNPTLTNGIIGGAYTVTDSGGSGFATVTGGDVLRLADPGNAGLPASGAVSGSNYFINSGYSPNSTITPGSLALVVTATESANTVTVNTNGSNPSPALSLGANKLTITSGGGLLFSGTNPYSITGSGGLTSSASAGSMFIDNFGSGTVTIATPILANGANTVILDGTGATIFSAANTYGGATTVNAGTLTLSGTYTGGAAFTVNSGGALTISGASNGNVIVSSAGNNVAVANVSGAITLANGNTITAGNTAGGIAVLNILPGAVISGGNSPVDAGINGLGVINMTGGTVTPGQFLVAGITNSGADGIWNISGGTVSINSSDAGTLGATAGATGVLNMTGTGVYNSSAANTASGIFIGENGTGILNLSGSGSVILGGGVANSNGLIIGKNNGASGIVNLGAVSGGGSGGSGGGTITTNVVQKPGATATAIFNFHGGTLQATSANANTAFMTGLTAAYVYGEGGTINNNGQSITIGQALLAPTGNGVASLALSGGTTGFTPGATPLVTITGGGGTGATAVANVNSSGVLSITLTNPGTGYTSAPLVSLTGGNAAVVTASIGADTSGGLTFSGTGTTTLSAANTYTGATSITAGTLSLTGSLTGSAVSTSGSGILTESAGGVIAGSGSFTQGSPGTSILAGNNTYIGPTTVNAGTLTISGTTALASAVAVNGGTLTTPA